MTAIKSTTGTFETDTFETVTYAVDGPVAIITHNRPEKRNAESLQLIEERSRAFELAGADPSVQVVVLAGAGPSFSSGHDLKELNNDPWMLEKRSTQTGRIELEDDYYLGRSLAIRNFPKPTVAAVHGPVVAGGLMTAAMCDLIIAADNAIFSDPVLSFGPNGAAAVEVLFHPWQMGARKAKEFLWLGTKMTAAEALDCGFVNRVVPLDQLMDETMGMAHGIAAHARPRAAAMTKKSINAMLDRQGQLDSYQYHFLMHQLSHSPD